MNFVLGCMYAYIRVFVFLLIKSNQIKEIPHENCRPYSVQGELHLQL